MTNCPYSGSYAVPQKDDGLPVECPECGAVRKRKKLPDLHFVFGAHAPLDGATPDRTRYVLVNRVWQIVEKGQGK